jgi:hypothetical protein
MDRRSTPNMKENIVKYLRDYAAKLVQAADLIDNSPNQKATTAEPKRKVKRSKMSKAARLKISRAQKARWKLYHGGKKAA